MTKEKRLNIKIKDIELSFLHKNLPPEFDSVSDFARVTLKEAIQGGKFEKQSSSLDSKIVIEKLEEYHERQISEILQNRALLTGVQEIVQSVARKKSDRLKQLSISELVQHYLENRDMIKNYDDFAAHVKFPHLNEFVMDAIDELAAKKLITLKGEKVVWHEV